MRLFSALLLLILACSLKVAARPAHADELEHDRCSCKLVMKGAESTLKGGVCVRTEAATCLMEWGGGSKGKAVVGNGLSQSDSGDKAQLDFAPASETKFVIPRMGPAPDGATQLEIAFGNLSRVPPEAYGNPGIAESFLLAAGSALERYAEKPLTFLAISLIRNRRPEFIKLLSDGGDLTVEQFSVHGNRGCLIIADRSRPVSVYVMTPFAMSDRC
jgi:hypothetical protein